MQGLQTLEYQNQKVNCRPKEYKVKNITNKTHLPAPPYSFNPQPTSLKHPELPDHPFGIF